MDGDGQSMLSIAQGPRDAGVVFTLIDGKYGSRATAVLAINTTSRPYHRSLGINTKFKPTHHSGTQANDSRYTSKYQLAHCSLKPSSPSVHLPEFPLQRNAPNLTEGNFEVRGWRNNGSQYMPVRTHSFRGNLHWTDRVESVYRWSEDTSAFAHSLRKYPNLSPNTSLSTELVQRLLTYTQNKSFSKSSYHTRMRATGSPLPETNPTECTKTSSRNVQTSTKRDRTNKAINTLNEIRYQGKVSRESRHIMKDNRPSNTYDYLKRTKPRGWNTRGTEVRYLTDVTKCIKDAIRNICEEATTPATCQSVQSRYSQHRRMHHLHTNGQQATSVDHNINGEGASLNENTPRGIMRCDSPNDVCARVRNRNNQNKKQRQGGHKSCSVFKTIDIQASPPPVMREACVMTKSESYSTLPHVCEKPVKACCYCKKLLPCHCRSETNHKIEKEVLDWIKEIPVYSGDTRDNRDFRCMLSKKLIETLGKIIKNTDFDKIKEEIDKCLNVLPMWCPENDNDKTIFKKQIAENLMNRLKQFMVKDFFKDQIVLWFNELAFKDQMEPEDREQFLNNFVNNLKAVDKLPHDDDYKEALKNEMHKMLNEIPGIDKVVIMQMANKLADHLVLTEKKESAKNNELRKNICDWIDKTSEFVENGFYVKDNIQLIDDLSKILTDQQQLGTNIEDIKKLMKTGVTDWLQTAYKNKNVFLDINTKSKLAQKLIDNIHPNQNKTATDEYVRSIIDWLKDTPELSHCFNEIALVEKLANKLRELQKKEYDNDALLEVIVEWINQLCEEHGIFINPKVFRQHTEKLIDKLKLHRIPRKPRKLAKIFKETISDQISRILESDALTLNSKIKNNLQNKITNIFSNNIEKVLSNERHTTKTDLIKLLQHEGNMTLEEAKDLAETFINSTKNIPMAEVQKEFPAKSLHSKNNKDVKRDISNVDELEETDVDNKEIIEETMSNILPDEIIRGTKAEITRNDIYNFFNGATVPNEQSDEVTPRFIKRQRIMSLEPSPDLNGSKVAQQGRGVVSAPIHKDVFKHNVERTISDFIDDVLVNHSSKTTENMRIGAKVFVDTVSQLIQRHDDKESILKEVQSFLNSIPISSDITRKELSDELTNRLLGTGFQTSTPRKDFSFQPRRLTFDSSLASVHFEDGSQQITEESKYSEDLTKVVINWLDKMPLSLNESESQRFKDIVIYDLVGDLIDRQKYLQMKPGAKSLDIDELENLKYQVFRWLNKVMDVSDFDILMPQIKELMDAVRGVAVPQLAKPSGVRKDVKKSQGQVPNYLDALQDEISVWVDDIPKHLLQSTDKKYHDQMIGELVKHLQHVNSDNINSKIKQCLKKFFRFSDQDDINKAAQDLNQRLARKGFSKDISWMIKQDSSEFIEENLHGAILDWLKQSPYYQSANIQDRDFQERIVACMAKGIKNVFEIAPTTSEAVDINDLFMDEIVKHIKGFPMDKKKKTDPSSLNNIAANLLQYLKGLQIFQNISDRHSTTPQNHLNNSIEQWINSLPIVDKVSLTEGRPFKTLTKQFKQKLNDLSMRGDDKCLREEIKKQLKMLPIDPVKLNDDKFINKKIEQLLKKIHTYQVDEITGSEYEDISLHVDSNFSPRHDAKSATDTLSRTVNKFCDSLLIEKGILSEDTDKVNAIKHSMASKLLNKIKELNVNPEIINDDFLYKHISQDELDNLIRVSQPSAETKSTVNEINKNLLNKAKDNTKSELARQIYKQQLRDTISKTLPPTGDLSVDEKTSFEVLKGNVADAFINLHFYGGNTEEREKYKSKINKEISKFCNDYLKKHPSTPIEAEKLNKDLYTMLNNITFPTEDSILEKVDETNIKDLITDCANELPLSQDTSVQKLQADRVMSLMSKQLHELEKDKDILDNYEGILKNEICKWTKKLPLQYWREKDIRDFADKLVGEIKRTEALRRSKSTSMNTVDFDRSKHSVTPPQLSREQSRPSRVADNVTSRLPPSSLSSEDHHHLQRIRERSMSGRRFRTAPIQKDASISPAPIDAESQTEIRPLENNLGIQRSPSIQTATQIDQPPHVCQSPACGLRYPRPWLQLKGSHCHLSESPERCTKFNWPMQGKEERLLPRDIIQPESDPQDMKSSNCECHRKFIPYSFSPGQNYAVPRSRMSSPRRAPNVLRPFQFHPPEDVPTTKRPKRRDSSTHTSEEKEKPRKTIRPRTTGLGACEPARCTRKTPANYEQTYGIRHLHDASSCGLSSRREVLISDDEFEDQGAEEIIKCRCKEGNTYGRVSGLLCKGECLKNCPKCCGVHCPHPTHLYFRK